MSTSAKENILKKIREALSQPVPLPFPNSEGGDSLVQPSSQEPEIEFAEQFTLLQGKFMYCADNRELAQQLDNLTRLMQWNKIYCREEAIRSVLKENGFVHVNHPDLEDCDASITGCECLVARTGSIVMSAAEASGRTTSVYAPVHICIAYMKQLVYDVKDALQLVKEKYRDDFPSLVTFATGPSRTADIEKTLVVGVHGPREVYVFLVERK